MNKEKEKWKGQVLESMKGSNRAQPKADLFAKIEKQLYGTESKIISFRQWSLAAAVAFLLLFTNAIAFYQINQSSNQSAMETIEEVDDQALISNYYIYE